MMMMSSGDRKETFVIKHRRLTVSTRPVREAGGCMGCYSQLIRHVRVIRMHNIEMRLCGTCATFVSKGLMDGFISVDE